MHTGELKPEVALPFYYLALDLASRQLAQAHPGRKVQLVAHSIGGWIARSYLGQLDAELRAARFGALVTLGTPHAPPPEGLFRTLDQTRGLLRYVQGGAAHSWTEWMRMACCSHAHEAAARRRGRRRAVHSSQCTCECPPCLRMPSVHR